MLFLAFLAILQAAPSPPSLDLAPVKEAIGEKAFDKALDRTRRLLRDNPGDPRVWTLQGFAHAGLNSRSEALADFRQAVARAPNYLPALKAEAQLEYETGNEQAPATLRRVISLDPQDRVSHAMLGALSYKQRDCKSTVEHYAKSESLISSQASAVSEYGECLFKQGQTDKSVYVLERAANVPPRDWPAVYNLAIVELLTQRPAQALTTLQPLLGEGEAHREQALDLAASASEQLGDTPKAVERLREAILSTPDDVNLYLHFADLCFAHNSFSVGIDMVDAGLTKLPRSPRLLLARGILLVQMGEYGRAEADFAEASKIDPSQSFSSVAQGLTQLQKSNVDEALAITREQIKRTPADGFLHYVEAETLRQKGVAPGSAEFGEALRAAATAVQLKPRFAPALDLLGTFYLRQNRLDLAVQQFTRTLDLDPNNQSALYHLITAERKRGHLKAIPDLMKRLVEAKAAQRKSDELANRYSFIGSSQVNPSQKN